MCIRPGLWLVFASLIWSGAGAQSVSYNMLQGQLQRASQNITTLGHDLMGDRVNLYNGALEFAHEDVSLPGNSALAVAVGRRHVVGRDPQVRGQLGDWDLDLPSIGGNFATAHGWRGGAGAARCSGYARPADYSYGDGRSYWYAFEFWHGTFLYVPGAGQQELLYPPSGAVQPTDGHAWHLTTANHWRIRCLPSILNGGGEGFVAKSPDGTEYTFNWVAARALPVMRSHTGVMMGRSEIRLLPTLVKDRFGNTVSYSYDTGNPWQLRRIESSDGRVVVLAYGNFSGGSRLASVTDGSRSWTYGYNANGDLSTVTLPDASAWHFALRALVYPYPHHLGDSALCDWPGAWPGDTLAGQVTHPSGAVGTFHTAYVMHPRDNVFRHCFMKVAGQTYDPEQPQGSVELPLYPKETVSQTLVRKTLAGPGLAELNWTYNYPSRVGTWSCPACTGRKHVVVTDPRSVQTRYAFGTKFQADEGQLLQRDDGWSGTSALRTITYRYRQPAGQAYAEPAGTSPTENGDYLAIRHRPLDRRVTTQQGVDFTWQADAGAGAYDDFARPLLTSRSSTLGHSVAEAAAYYDNRGLWVMGQTSSITTAGIQSERTVFNAANALPTAKYSFGRPVGSFTYNADGTVLQLLDPLGRPTTFADWWRGIPRRITGRDGSVQTAQVNNLGRITSYTNAAGATTGYGYDAMGRLSSISHPAEATGVYHPTNLVFERVDYPEYGIPASHWRQTVTTGNARTVRYLDALWRVGLTQTLDLANPNGTASFVINRYDPDGRKVFESRPLRNITGIGEPSAGTTWFHDPLGRTAAQSQDSELGALNTVTEYLGAFQRRTTNPRGHATTMAFQAFDTPSEDAPIAIWAPEGVSTAITRDAFGKATAITRGGGGLSATRSYVYDLHQRLCKTIEPESGATVQDYDGAGNVAWRAAGLSLPGGTCDQASAPAARKVSFGYDAMDRLSNTSHGDGSPGISRSYTADGLLSQISSSGISWTYSYNQRRLLTQERYVWPGLSPGQGWSFAWGIDGYGNVASLTDPWGTMHYSPNALGQPTQVSGYASNVSHHPDGTLAGYTLANGISHSVSLNTRGLPQHWRDGSALHYEYSYDAAGNVTGIGDRLQSVASRSMAYDGLDRLASASGIWGAGSFGYDTLDNLRSSTIGSRVLAHHYDGYNRLASITGSQNLGLAYDANGNLTQRGGQGFGFDIGNRMSAAVGQASYLYDGHGRRSLTYFADGAVRLDAYIKDGRLLFSWRAHQGHTRHVYLGSKLIAETIEGGVITFAHTDALGSPVTKSNAAGTVVSRTQYEPYGGIAQGTVPTKVGFTGHVNDPETGLVYMQQRYYDPVAGRFLSVDPVATDDDNGALFNRYLYAAGSPYRFYDPDGACTGSRITSGSSDVCASTGGFSTGMRGAIEGMRAAIDGGHGAKFAAALGSGDGLSAVGHLAAGVLHSGATIVGSIAAVPAKALGVVAAKGVAAEMTTVIGRVKDLKRLPAGEKSLLDRLPNLGDPKANWAQNSGVLRQEMGRGLPIRDASPHDVIGKFLNAERNLLRDRGWTFDRATNYWMPPKS